MRRSGGAAVVGSGPNGLAAAVTLARAGVPVTVFEAAETPGGGTRTAELVHPGVVHPGVVHDVCSAVHPMALASGFFAAFELTRRVQFVVPDASYAHPLGVGRAAVAYRDLARTADGLGRDGAAYARLYAPLLRRLDGVIDFALGGGMLRLPRDPLAAFAVATRALEQGSPLWNLRFRGEAAPALVTGAAAHNIGPLPGIATAAVGLVLGALGHASGWPVPVGGSAAIAQALVADLRAHGGTIVTGHRVRELGELDRFEVKLFDTSTAGLAEIAGAQLPPRYRAALRRFAFGDAAAKVDFVLDGPIPWADARVAAAPTVHLGGTRAEIAAAEREVARGRHPARPYVLLTQPTAFDPGRNPPGTHTIWSYAHVPHGSTVDMTDAVTARIEAAAPGFRDRIVAVRGANAADLARYNPNYVGGDFSAGRVNLRQLIARPVVSAAPWRTPLTGVYLASSATSPGPGVHGLSGWYAARLALREVYGLEAPGLGLGVPQ